MKTMVNIKMKYIKGKTRIYALKKVIRYAIVKVLKNVSTISDSRAKIDFLNGISYHESYLKLSILNCWSP